MHVYAPRQSMGVCPVQARVPASLAGCCGDDDRGSLPCDCDNPQNRSLLANDRKMPLITNTKENRPRGIVWLGVSIQPTSASHEGREAESRPPNGTLQTLCSHVSSLAVHIQTPSRIMRRRQQPFLALARRLRHENDIVSTAPPCPL